MGLSVVTPPTEEPVTVSGAKDHLRVETNADDALIGSLITTARTHVEHLTNRALVTQTLRFTTNDFASTVILPRAPVTSVSSISLLDTDGNSTVVTSGTFVVDTTRVPHRLQLLANQDLPSLDLEKANAVTVDFVAGYGNAADVPEPLKAAIQLLVGHLYENREPVVIGAAVNQLPMTFKALIDSYVVHTEAS